MYFWTFSTKNQGPGHYSLVVLVNLYRSTKSPICDPDEKIMNEHNGINSEKPFRERIDDQEVEVEAKGD